MTFFNQKKRKFFKKQGGFTLVELLIYVTILAVMLSVVVDSGIKLASVYRTLETVRNINLSSVTALERMIREIRSASGFSQTASVFNVNPGVLELSTLDSLGQTMTIKFFVSNGVLRVYENGADSGALTFGSSTVSNLIFRQIQTPKSKAIKIELSIDSGVPGATKSASFSSTAVLRAAYNN